MKAPPNETAQGWLKLQYLQAARRCNTFINDEVINGFMNAMARATEKVIVTLTQFYL